MFEITFVTTEGTMFTLNACTIPNVGDHIFVEDRIHTVKSNADHFFRKDGTHNIMVNVTDGLKTKMNINGGY